MTGSHDQPRSSIYFTLILTFAMLPINSIWAAMPEKDYKAAMELAQQKVQRKNALRSLRNASTNIRSNPSSHSLSPTQPWLKELLNKSYKVGDQWDVAAWHLFQPMSKVTNDESQITLDVINFGIFHYEVVEMQNGSNPTLTLKVTQKNTDTHSTIDPKIDSLQLKMTEEFEQIEKKYTLHCNKAECKTERKTGSETERSAKPSPGNSIEFKVSPEGIRSQMTPLELMPLDIPEIFSASRKTLSHLPTFPTPIASYAKKIDFNPDLSKCIYFQQDDFFGRPIDVLWQQGDPWPSYMKTAYGIALLIQKEKL